MSCTRDMVCDGKKHGKAQPSGAVTSLAAQAWPLQWECAYLSCMATRTAALSFLHSCSALQYGSKLQLFTSRHPSLQRYTQHQKCWNPNLVPLHCYCSAHGSTHNCLLLVAPEWVFWDPPQMGSAGQGSNCYLGTCNALAREVSLGSMWVLNNEQSRLP